MAQNTQELVRKKNPEFSPSPNPWGSPGTLDRKRCTAISPSTGPTNEILLFLTLT